MDSTCHFHHDDSSAGASPIVVTLSCLNTRTTVIHTMARTSSSVLAVPGDTVRFENNRLVINGEPIPTDVTEPNAICDFYGEDNVTEPFTSAHACDKSRH